MAGKKLPKFKSEDWLTKAKDLPLTFYKRMEVWLSDRPECAVVDFINTEIEIWEQDLKEPFTVGSYWDRYEKIIKDYILFIKNKRPFIENVKIINVSKLDYTPRKLREIVIELTELKGYERPSTFLNEHLDIVKSLDDFEFLCDFYLNIHSICKENIDLFWSEGHKKDISNWLKSAPINTNVFDETWIKTTEKKEAISKGLTMKQIALIYYYKGQAITRDNSNFIAIQHGHNSGEALFQKYSYYTSSANRKGKTNPFTPKKMENKIALLESVINHLPEQQSSLARDELNILVTLYKNEFQ